MQAPARLPVQVTAVSVLSPSVKLFTLAAVDGRTLPAFTAGGHIVVTTMGDGGRPQNNAYSILSSPLDTRHYEIAVQLEEPSRGGSTFMHEKVQAGSMLQICEPANLFALAPGAARHVLIGGGIGITPLLAHVATLEASRSEYELHYCVSDERDAVFRPRLEAAARAGRIHLHVSSQGSRLDVAGLFDRIERDDHVYVCGPAGLNAAVFEAGRARNWPPAQLHAEQFGAPKTAGRSFTVVLARRGLQVQVGADQTILEALELARVGELASMCREGYCGTCETDLMDGEADHLDQYLQPEQKQAQRSIMICVSRARTPRLVLDL